MDNQERFERNYRRWTYLQSIVCLALLVAASPFFPLSPRAVALVLAGWGAVTMSLLLASGVRLIPFGAAMTSIHVLTGVRTIASVVVLLLVSVHGGREVVAGTQAEALGVGAFMLSDHTSWIVGAFLALVETTDFIDGRLARTRRDYRRGENVFGAAWDMENDSFFALALSFAAWQIAGLPIVVLLIGAMRYFYFLLVRAEGDPPGHHPAYKIFAKSTAATLVIVLIVIYMPILPHALRGALVYGALGVQVISFSWDLTLRVRSGTVMKTEAS